MTTDDYDALRMKMQNEAPGNLKYYDCPVCRNKGYIITSIHQGIVDTQQCECMKIRNSKRLIEKSGIAPMLERCSIDTYSTESDWQRGIKAKAEDYLKKGRGHWFFIAGRPGTGKTHICTAICKAVLERNHSVRYMMWRTDAPKLKAMVNDRESYDREIDSLLNADVLYIDDFFKGDVTSADINLAFEIINGRYIGKKSGTIISSELPLESILDLDEAIGSRIAEKSAGYIIFAEGENYRLRKVTK